MNTCSHHEQLLLVTMNLAWVVLKATNLKSFKYPNCLHCKYSRNILGSSKYPRDPWILRQWAPCTGCLQEHPGIVQNSWESWATQTVGFMHSWSQGHPGIVQLTQESLDTQTVGSINLVTGTSLDCPSIPGFPEYSDNPRMFLGPPMQGGPLSECPRMFLGYLDNLGFQVGWF